MAVIEILDIDMPKNCKECENRNCNYYHRVWWDIDDESKDYTAMRNPKCPLRSIEGFQENLKYKMLGKTFPINHDIAIYIDKVFEIVDKYIDEHLI